MADSPVWWFHGQELFIRMSGATYGLTALGSRVVKIRVNPDLPTIPVPAVSQNWSIIEDSDTQLKFASGGLLGTVTLSDGTVRWETPEGQLLDQDHNPIRCEHGQTVLTKDRLYSHYLGGGQSALPLDKRGSKVTFWNRDAAEIHTELSDSLYQSHPIWWGWSAGKVWGTYIDSGARITADFTGGNSVCITVESLQFTYYGIYDTHLDGVLSRFSRITGYMPLPPLWALGYQQSRWSYQSADEALTIAKTFRERKIPCDVIYLDIDYMHGYRIFTWDPQNFPDPRGLIHQLHQLQFHVVAIVDPGIKADPDWELYQDAFREHVLVTYHDGSVVQGQVWPGPAVFPDFFNPQVQQWWVHRIALFLDTGIDGIWNDMNEPSLFDTPNHSLPDDAVHKPSPDSVISHRLVHNYYGREMAKASFLGMESHDPDARPFVLSRAGFSELQKWSAIWTGDNHSLFSALRQMIPMLLSLSLSGQPFIGADVGGFQGNCQPELFARWVAAAALTPFFRNHSAMGTTRQEPWSFGPEVERQVAHLIAWRYRLLPTLYQLFWEAHRYGRPIMRPMVYHYENAPQGLMLQDQFLVGSELLVAPILDTAADHRAVWFPDGTWYSLDTSQVFRGAGYDVVQWPLGVLPVFVKDDSLLLVQAPQITALPLPTRIQWMIHLSRGIKTAWYQDDGVSHGYRAGQYNLMEILVELRQDICRITTGIKHQGFPSPTTMVDIWIYDPTLAISQLRFNGVGLDFVRQQDAVFTSVPTAWIWQTSAPTQ
ncbi:MAG: alpha-glucosidase [Sulfobacillus benefaciens]|uniref:Alpha-glucosidase n=1 Tax=Sulfobacillus benefaciens TaxID=453960 RepID=A0A2T2X4I8_9FIRM|nr:MAG: alpha-glucosidase [Sulfobacillus benefaciens]